MTEWKNQGAELIIHRGERAPFTMVPNLAIQRSPELSFKDLGILAYLLSRPEGWRFRVTELIDAHTDGRDAVYSGLRRLEDLGWIRRSSRGDGGRYAHTTLEVFLSPGEHAPCTDNPDTALPDTDNPTLERLSSSKTEESNTPPSPPSGEQSEIEVPGFDSFLQELVVEWQRVAQAHGLPMLFVGKGLPPESAAPRESHIRQARKVYASEQWRDNWHRALTECLPALDFYCGRESRSTWKADLTHFLRPDAVFKILERYEAAKAKGTLNKSVIRDSDYGDNQQVKI